MVVVVESGTLEKDLFLNICSSDKECRSVVDIAFVIDSSGSVGRRDWERMKRFVKSIVSKLDVSSSATRIAAVAYSTNPEVVMLFRNFQGTDEVNRLLDRMRWQRGLTYTDRGLLFADSRLFQLSNGMRQNVRKVSTFTHENHLAFYIYVCLHELIRKR